VRERQKGLNFITVKPIKPWTP